MAFWNRKNIKPTEEQRLISAETTDRLYRQAPIGMLATVINAAVLAAVEWKVNRRQDIIVWLSCLGLATIYRIVQVYQFRSGALSRNQGRPEGQFVGEVALIGLAWGAAGILLFPVSSFAHQVFLAFVLGGMVAGAAGTFSISFSTFLAFGIPTLLPIILSFLAMGDAVHVAMGGLMLLFGIMISSVAMGIHRSWSAAVKLRFENENLVAYLATTKERADKLNDKLLLEIAGREKVELSLQQHRDNLEHLVRERTAELSFANDLLQKEIGARKDAETALIKSEEYFRTLIENTLDIITVLDDRGMILFESPSVAKLLGYDPVDLVGKSIFDFIHPDDKQPSRAVFINFMSSPGTTIASEVRFRHRDGSWHIIETRGKGVRDAGQGMRVIINSRDVTERRKLESDMLRAQKLESLGTLAGGIAHDFNNLITGITINLELAKLRTESDAELLHLLAHAEQAALRAKVLTQQLLTFSQGGAPVKTAILLQPLLNEAVSFALHGSKVACDFSLPDDLPSLEGDEGQLRHVIHNIVINAVQAMPQGGIIKVSASREELNGTDGGSLAPGVYLKITIQDHGAGIPQEYLPRIFDPFFTTKSASGLGLATSYSIVRKHGGDILVSSEPDVGTTVSLLLPASRVKAAPKPESVGLVIGTGRILIMDDEDIIRDAARKILEAAGYDVETAKDGNEAVVCYRKAGDEGRPFNAVILDLTVPGGTGGRETMQRLMELDPGVKAIVSSGYSNDPIMANYREYGFQGVIAKPYRVREMSEIVRQVVTGS